jgi:hypothetical protein
LALRNKERLTRRDATLRVGLVIALVAVAVPPALTLSLGHPLWLVAALGSFLVLLIWHRRVRRALVRAERLIGYYRRGLARLDGLWAGTGNPGTELMPADHPYAADLDIFGVGSLFERLNSAHTGAGARTLGAWLLAPASLEQIRSRQDAIAELRGQLDLREELYLHGADVPAGIDLDGLARWGTEPPLLPSPLHGNLLFTLLAAAGILALVPLAPNWWTGAVYGVLLGQAVFCWMYLKRVSRVVAPLKRRSRDLMVFYGLLRRIEQQKFRAASLVQIQESLRVAGRPPSRCIRQLARLAGKLWIMEYPEWRWAGWLAMLTTRVAFALEAWRRVHGPHIGRWLETVACFEALSSLATYAYENPGDPFAEFAEPQPQFEAKALGHPLLPGCVRNDVQLGGSRQGFIVTGSNMSGKSTLLRAAGVNAVLALAGAPVRAESLRLSPLAVAASIRVQDSLQAGRSRFLAEIRKLRQMVDMTRDRTAVLFLIDEVLQGTNPADRQVGASAVILELLDKGALGLITTHDLPLTRLAEQSGQRLANVHFSDRFEDGQPSFDYQMRSGVIPRSNALALMRAIGLSVKSESPKLEN